ncbi:Serpin B12 [Clonorchis sinensis]|uniref:Serpin B12 n=1 Tax=Clonorchis sinensis TaxID=79923 RepID=A0A3R7CXR6_CLOSI|nr:Serpin B12 [Clonorchis sinensis]
MTLVGAGGQTRLELRQTMRIPPELEGAALHEMFGSALRSISTQSTDVTVSLANRLFVFQNMNIRDEFSHMLSKDYSAEAESLVNYADLEAKRQRINQWVSETTNSRIPELFAQGALNVNSLLTLVNTVYLKDTMGAILMRSFVSEEVDLELPRFRLSESPPLNMKLLLQSMGVRSMFDKTADLSNLSPDANIYVSDLVHKAVIMVDEQGAEAAAGSGIEISPTSIPDTMEFHVDHPFLTALVYRSTIPAFIGHVFDPEVMWS